jgi:hypothetical protein
MAVWARVHEYSVQRQRDLVVHPTGGGNGDKARDLAVAMPLGPGSDRAVLSRIESLR